MKTESKDFTSVIEEVLPKYFNREQITEFLEKINQQLTSTPMIDSDATDNKDKFGDINLRTKIDLLTTFALLKLNHQNFIKLFSGIGQVFITAGEFDLALDIYKKIISQTKTDSKYTNIYAQSLLAAGEIFSRQAQWQESFSSIRKAFAIFLKHKDYNGAAKCENIVGTIYGEMGNILKAKQHLLKSLEYLKKKPDNKLKAGIEINLGILNTITSDYEDALAHYNNSFKYYNKAADLKRMAEIKQNLGMVYLKQNKLSEALSEFDQSIDYALGTDYMQIIEIAYLSKAYLYTRLKEYQYAEKFANSALKICCKINDRLSIADIYKIKGIIHRQLANYPLSESYFLTSLRLNKELQNKLNEAETSFELALLYKDIQRLEESKRHFTRSLQYFSRIKAANEVKNIRANMV